MNGADEMTDKEKIKELEDRIKLLEHQIGIMKARFPFRSLGRKRHAPFLKDTIVPGRDS
jgi:hypothetical protein